MKDLAGYILIYYHRVPLSVSRIAPGLRMDFRLQLILKTSAMFVARQFMIHNMPGYPDLIAHVIIQGQKIICAIHNPIAITMQSGISKVHPYGKRSRRQEKKNNKSITNIQLWPYKSKQCLIAELGIQIVKIDLNPQLFLVSVVNTIEPLS